MNRTLLKGGSVIDGTGKPAIDTDVLIDGDRIASIRPDLQADAEAIDVSGLCIAPGFVDLHSHGDFSLLAFPGAESAIMQGITTVVTGNCGGGVAPLTTPDDVHRVGFAVDQAWGVEVNWTSFGEYTEQLDRCAVNVSPLVAHGAIRNCVMGMEAREPHRHELDQLIGLLVDCLDEGAFGFSTGLEYRPGVWTSEAEIRQLVFEVGKRDRLYATHMRGRAKEHAESTDEALRTVDGTDARLQLSHFAPRPNAPKSSADEAFRLVEEAVSDGRRVGIDTFPEIWGPALLIDLFPSPLMDGSPAQVLDRLSSPPVRQAIAEHFEQKTAFLARVAGYEEIYIADTPQDTELSGRRLTDLAAEAGSSVAEVCCDLLLGAQEEHRSVSIRHIYATEEDVRRTLALPYCSIESDGIVTSGEGNACPMVWNASSYGYTARVLGHYVRNERFFRLEEAVRRMSSLPASAVGLKDRGMVREGAIADLVVFSADDVTDRTTPESPARHPRGFKWVFINGIAAVAHGKPTAKRPGRLLRP